MDRRLPTTFWVCMPFSLLFFAGGVFTIGRHIALPIASFAMGAVFTLVANLYVARNHVLRNSSEGD